MDRKTYKQGLEYLRNNSIVIMERIWLHAESYTSGDIRKFSEQFVKGYEKFIKSCEEEE